MIVPVSSYDVVKTRACHSYSHDNLGNPETSMCTTALFTVFLVALTCALNWLSYIKHSNTYSFLGFLAAVWVCAFINLNQWPYSGECVITNMFQGTLFGNLCNGAVTIRNHLVRMIIMFAVASYVSIQSPYSVYHEDVLPLLGGPIIMAVAFLVATRCELNSYNYFDYSWTVLQHVDWNHLTVQGSRWVLSAIYMYHVCCELLSMSFDGSFGAKDIFATLVKATILAGMGVVATGTFQQEIDMNAKLEVMVKNRTRIIQEKNDKLHMVELALECSETAIAITDSKMNIIWLNAACEDISSRSEMGLEDNQHKQVILGRPIVEVIALETIMDEKKLTQAFSSSRKEDEICINGMIFRLEVSPYEYSSPTSAAAQGKITQSDDSGRFLVVLKNITAKRAQEVAEKTAQEEAMLAKAMGDSMVTLTVSYPVHCDAMRSVRLCVVCRRIALRWGFSERNLADCWFPKRFATLSCVASILVYRSVS